MLKIYVLKLLRKEGQQQGVADTMQHVTVACMSLLDAGIIGKQLTLGKAASTMSRFSYSLPRNPSGTSGLLSGDSIPIAMSGSERRRSMTMGHIPGVGRLSRATSRCQDVVAPRDTRYIISHSLDTANRAMLMTNISFFLFFFSHDT